MGSGGVWVAGIRLRCHEADSEKVYRNTLSGLYATCRMMYNNTHTPRIPNPSEERTMKRSELSWIDAGRRLREVGATVVAYGMKPSRGIVECRDHDGGWKWESRPEMSDLYSVIFKLRDAVVCTACDTVQDVLDTCTDYPCPELTVHHSPESADGVATVNIGSLRVYIDYSAATARGTGGLLLVDVQDADGKQTPFECFGNADVRFTQVDRD